MRKFLRALLVLGLCASSQGADVLRSPGSVCFVRRADPGLDRFTNSPPASMQEWFRKHFTRMVVFTPYFDTRTHWYPNGLVYINLYAIPPDSALVSQHPEWILRDGNGNRLYIPWGCSGGKCAQFAGDITNPEFRENWIARARTILARHYRGMWIDDVNLEFRVSDGNGQAVPTVRAHSGALTAESWRDQVAGFVEEIRRALPDAEIVHNPIWFAGPRGVRDADPAIRRQIAAADHINVERGIGSDPGLTGGRGEWSLDALFAYIDRVHAAGKGVTLEEMTSDRKNREYALAGYFLISSGRDCITDPTDPEHWWAGYETDLGEPLGPRSEKNGIFERRYAHGLVLLGEPGAARSTVPLPREFRTLDGVPVHEVVISGHEGAVLTYQSQ